MKNILVVLATLVSATGALAGTASLQVIHNSADPAAAVVDVYVNGDLVLDDFAFREATPFLEVPSGVTLEIGVAPGTSGSAEDVLATFPVVLERGNRYVVFANGVLDPAGFAANPEELGTGFSLYPLGGIPARTWFGVKLYAFHGATDAPAVDVRRRTDWGSYPVAGGLSYGEFAGPKTLLPRDYVLDVTPAGAPETVVASFDAPLSGLWGQVVTVFASGFLSPAENQDGRAFGLFAALSDGTVVALPPRGRNAALQVVHNAADPAAAAVDVYVNGERVLDDFAFRTATPFLDVPAGVELNVGIAPGTSESADDVIATFPFTLEPEGRYVVVANGVLDPSGYAGNPGGASIGFDLYPLAAPAEPRLNLVRLLAFHGATDAPAVDVRVRNRWFDRAVFRDLAYGEAGGPALVLPRQLTLDVTPAGDPQTVVASYLADLRGLGRGAAVVVASGFLDPSANGDGPSFGLYAVLADGTMLALPAAPQGMEADLADKAGVPLAFGLEPNYPNPFNPSTTLAFNVARAGRVTVDVLDVRGRVVRTLSDGTREPGRHTLTFQGDDLASGTYFARIRAGDQMDVRKMTLIK